MFETNFLNLGRNPDLVALTSIVDSWKFLHSAKLFNFQWSGGHFSLQTEQISV